MQNDSTQEREPRATPATRAVPHVVSLERVGWRIMHQAPGKAKKETGSYVDKTGATELAAFAAQAMADETGTTVELHTQDVQGRPSGIRYFDPTPKAALDKGGAK